MLLTATPSSMLKQFSAFTTVYGRARKKITNGAARSKFISKGLLISFLPDCNRFIFLEGRVIWRGKKRQAIIKGGAVSRGWELFRPFFYPLGSGVVVFMGW